MTESSETILVSIRHSGAKTPCVIGPSADKTLADVRAIALYSFGIPDGTAQNYKLFAGATELVDLAETIGHLAAGETLVSLDLGAVPNTAPRDPRFELTPSQIEQITRIEAEAAELRQQMQRTGVDVSIAQLTGKRDESATTRISKGNVHVVEECYTVDDVKDAAAMRALEQLPDGAGNEAFLTAYKNRLKSH